MIIFRTWKGNQVAHSKPVKQTIAKLWSLFIVTRSSWDNLSYDSIGEKGWALCMTYYQYFQARCAGNEGNLNKNTLLKCYRSNGPYSYSEGYGWCMYLAVYRFIKEFCICILEEGDQTQPWNLTDFFFFFPEVHSTFIFSCIYWWYSSHTNYDLLKVLLKYLMYIW